METENKKKKREWVKTAAIIFLAVLLVLTFFSQTIMNSSLPEVATQYVTSGTINAKIRGNGTVTANESYEVSLKQTRKIKSVMVKEGQEVAAGDVLFILESEDSDEVKAAQETLEAEELSYEKALLAATNASATDSYAMKKAQKTYNDALAAYKALTNVDVSQLQSSINAATGEANAYKQAQDRAESELDAAKAQYSTASGSISEIEGQITQLQDIQDKASDLTAAQSDLERDNIIYGESYAKLQLIAGYSESMMAAYAKSPALITEADGSISQTDADFMSEAYNVITKDKDAVSSARMTLDRAIAACPLISSEVQVTSALVSAQQSLTSARSVIAGYETTVAQLQQNQQSAKAAYEEAEARLSKLQSAQDAAAVLASAEEALEQLVFDQSLGSDTSLDMKAQRERISQLREDLENLKKDYDAAEVTSDVNGVVGTIYVTAGNTAGAQTALCAINVTSRGYTVQISVTNEQAKQIKVGDTAEVTNYYWGSDLEATVQSIRNDPSNPGKGKCVVLKITGDVEPGTNLTLSIGQRSSNYDALVPNSAVRTDSNGSFVLAIVSKSSPLGNRYVATRIDVQVLATDDTLTAVSGISSGEYVITTSTKPVDAGTQVRLVDET